MKKINVDEYDNKSEEKEQNLTGLYVVINNPPVIRSKGRPKNSRNKSFL